MHTPRPPCAHQSTLSFFIHRFSWIRTPPLIVVVIIVILCIPLIYPPLIIIIVFVIIVIIVVITIAIVSIIVWLLLLLLLLFYVSPLTRARLIDCLRSPRGVTPAMRPRQRGRFVDISRTCTQGRERGVAFALPIAEISRSYWSWKLEVHECIRRLFEWHKFI